MSIFYFIFSHIAFFPVMHKSCPAHHQKVWWPSLKPCSCGKILPAGVLFFVLFFLSFLLYKYLSLLLGTCCPYVVYFIYFFCMHICRRFSCSSCFNVCGREEYIIGIFLVCFSVLSVRIILDIACYRNMAGSWARAWGNLSRVSKKLSHKQGNFTIAFHF